MRPKLKISAHRQSNNSVHFTLEGVCNDLEVIDLINELKKRGRDSKNLFIHTEGLNEISLSKMGRDVLERNLNNFSDNAINIRFTGGSESRFKNSFMMA
jgi:hypothetical protein